MHDSHTGRVRVVWSAAKPRGCFGTSTASAPCSTPVSCGARRSRHWTTPTQTPSHAPWTQSGPTPSCIRQRGPSTSSAPSQGNSGTWPFKVSKPTATAPESRCPPAGYGFECQGQTPCHQAGEVNPGGYGRICANTATTQTPHIRRGFVLMFRFRYDPLRM